MSHFDYYDDDEMPSNFGSNRNEMMSDDLGEFEESRSFNPQVMDSSTFKQRNDPRELVERFRLDIMNAYIDEVQEKGQDGIVRTKKKFKTRAGTTPKANKQGVADIISYIEKFVNSHTVQGNIDSMNEFRNKMRFISSDIIMHFMSHRDAWGVSMQDIDELIGTSINIIDLFLTRALYDKERSHYGEGFIEKTNRDIRPHDRPNIFSKTGEAIRKIFD
jgi:hypothetical protein